MNVKELIDELKEFPLNYKIIHLKGHYCQEIKNVSLTKTDPPKVKLE